MKSSGSKLWQFRYYRPLTKQRTKQSFGAYPAVSLSDARKLRAADYQLYDGDGLTLLIKSSGSKLWQFRYYRPLTKQRTKQSFGAYP
ncbi:hypothetical protein CP989_25360, partial [Enterobacter hormaechei]